MGTTLRPKLSFELSSQWILGRSVFVVAISGHVSREGIVICTARVEAYNRTERTPRIRSVSIWQLSGAGPLMRSVRH